jgi:serine/threonine-protein kinase
VAGSVVDVPIGSLLAGKYRIEQVLGHGGMGSVYLAENVDIGRKVAIKFLHGDFAADAGMVARFRQEARAAAAVGHPGIVDVLDLGTTDDGSEFIVMERLEGETLGSRIKREGRMAPAEAVRIACDVLAALGAAHERRILHRDLKPENVFLVARPVAATKILDFGISKFGGEGDVSLTQTGAVMGSPLYMSPEQARGARDVGPASDLYAVGAILYEALTGTPPFTGASYNEVLANLLTEQHRPLVEVRPEVGVELGSIVDSLLAKSTADRPQNARAVQFALQQAIADVGAPVTTPPHKALAGAPADTAAWSARRPGLLLAVGGLALIVVVAAAVLRPHRGEGTPPSSAPALPSSAPAPPSSAAPAAVKPAVAAIELRLIARPPSARWSLDGEPLGCNPCSVGREPGSRHLAVASAPAYLEAQLPLLFDTAREETVVLAKAPHGHRSSAAPAPAAARPLGIDQSNPFK